MRCQQGQLAFVKKSLRKENIGKVVTCKKYLGYYHQGDVITISGENFLAFDTDDYWIIESNNLETHFGKAKEAYILDSWLQPINPLNDEDLVEDKELVFVE